MNGNVQCQQTVIFCNNFNEMFYDPDANGTYGCMTNFVFAHMPHNKMALSGKTAIYPEQPPIKMYEHLFKAFVPPGMLVHRAKRALMRGMRT